MSKRFGRKNCQKKGDYIFTVKANQQKLKKTVADSFKTELNPKSWKERHAVRQERRRAQTTNKAHGRIEIRKIETTTRPCAGIRKAGWKGVRQVFKLTRTRIKGKKTTQETAYGICSLSREQLDAKELLKAVRGHWGIENSLHYVRDVTLKEDACRIRKGNAPQNMAITRNLQLFLLAEADCKNVAAALRRYAARAEEAWELIVRTK